MFLESDTRKYEIYRSVEVTNISTYVPEQLLTLNIAKCVKAKACWKGGVSEET